MSRVLAVVLLLLGIATIAIPVRAQDTDGLTELRSSGGVLAVTLVAEAGRIRIGGLDLDGATYNGLYAGPVLRVRPGDLLRIRLVNHLSQPTNLHFHGIRTSPLGNSDNVHLAVPAGSTFVYEVRIPVTQPPGLDRYHSHVHGISEWQVMHGLSGALVVDDATETPASAPERLFVLKEIVFLDDTGNPTIDDELHGIVQSINGNLDVTRTMRPGETQLWRFTNQSANRAFHIALQGHRFRIVAEDGEATIEPRMAEVLDIMPSSRVDVIVEGGATGRYEVISKGVMTGTGTARVLDRVLGHLVVAGAAAPPAAPMPAVPPPPDLRGVPIDASRSFSFTQDTAIDPDKQYFYINGRKFDADRVDVRVPLGAVEEWTVRNDSDDLHVFHIHQLGFQVVEINGVPAPFTGRVDTVRVPERGAVKLRLAFTDPVILGRFMFHCHVLRHEDRGMMGQIEVYDPRPSYAAAWFHRIYLHVWWWAHGVPWSLCGLGAA